MVDAIGPTQQHIRRMEPVAAPLEQHADVVALHHLLEGHNSAHLQLVAADGTATLIPDSVFCVLERVAQLMASGEAVSIVPVSQQLTTQQAADIINVSRQYLVRLLEEGRIPFVRTGTHRRVRVEDVLVYKRNRDKERAESLDELSRLSQQYAGYEELE